MKNIINQEIEIKALSINKAFCGRRFKTKEAKSYEKELWILLPTQTQIEGEVAITLEFWLKYYKTTDVSNLVKLLEDIIVKKGYIEDDRKVIEMHLYKYPSKENKIRITISKP